MGKMAVVILAAGKGKRMRSKVPKVVHRVAGRPLVGFPILLAQSLGCDPIVAVVGHGRELVEAEIERMGIKNIRFAHQTEQLGTGHAVATALGELRGHRGPVLILSGDVPLLDRASVKKLANAYDRAGGPLAFLTFEPDDPTGYGRVIRKGNKVTAIREDRDCTGEERATGEVNSGIYLIDVSFLRRSVQHLDSDNSQGELYLTDLVEMAARTAVAAVVKVKAQIVGGVNDRIDLASIEQILRARINKGLMRSGVTLCQPDTIRVDVDVKVGQDTEIGPGVQLLGRTKIGRDCRIETGAIIADSKIKDGAMINAYSVLEQVLVGAGAQVGPMARLRSGTVIGARARVGNFVELYRTVMGAGSTAKHFAFLGNGMMGERVNIGAGTIFCDFDGYAKHQTVLEDDVFVGSDSQLVAPVTVGKGAYVATGSTITRDVPPGAVAVARNRQKNRKEAASLLRRMLKSRNEKKE